MTLILLLALWGLGGLFVGSLVFATIGGHRLDAYHHNLRNTLTEIEARARHCAERHYSEGDVAQYHRHLGYSQAVQEIVKKHLSEDT